MKHTIDDLKKVWTDAGYELTPYAEHEIQKSIQKYKHLPALLVEYYQKIGRIKGQGDHILSVKEPDQLSKETDGEEKRRKLLVFANEMQSVDEFAIEVKDLTQENPLVYCGGDSYADIAGEGDYFFIPGTHPEISVNHLGEDTRTLMHTLWAIAYCVLHEQKNEAPNWVFQDDDIYGRPKQVLKEPGGIRCEIENKSQQGERLLRILEGREAARENDDFSLVKILEYSCSYAEAMGIPPVPKPCNRLGMIEKAPNLVELVIRGAILEDSSSLSHLGELKVLYLLHCDIKELDALKHMPKLKKLYLRGSQLADTSGLAALNKLTHIDISAMTMKDYSWLDSLKSCRVVNLNDTEITDLSMLEQMKQLQEISASNCKISDISGLKNALKLREAWLSKNQIRDLSVFAHLTNVQMLYLDENEINDISTLSGMENLVSLRISDTEVSDLKPLENCKKLKKLDISNTEVSDITPLSGLDNLKTLKR